jgi:16S rRNA (guanine1207-N2)-methyltransferase
MSGNPGGAAFPQELAFNATLRGREFTFHTTWGLFSPRAVDEGSRLLINELEVREDDLTLDIGCGYGAVGLFAASLSPRGQAHLVDRDFVAVEYASRNARANGLENCQVYLSNGFSAVPDQRFDVISSNLPAHAGNEMLSILIRGAHRHLKPGGKFYVVTVSRLRSYIKRNFNNVFGNYDKLKQGRTHTVSLAIKQ